MNSFSLIQNVKKLLIKFKSSEYLRNVATLASGTTIAQLISFSSAPILYRIYSKEDYGTLGTYMAISAVIGVFSTLRYNEAIMLEEDDENAKKVLWLNRYINIIFSLLTIIVFGLVSGSIAKYLHNPNLYIYLFLIPVSIFFSGQNELYKIWANRKKEYRLISLNAIIIAALVPIVSIPFGIFYKNATGLFVGLIISQILPTILFYKQLNNKYKLSNKASLVLNDLYFSAYKHKNFPLFSLPADFINNLTRQLPVFMLSTYFNTSTVGAYNLCIRMLGLPTQLISNSISSIFKEKSINDFYKHGNCKNIFIKTAGSLLFVSIGPFLFMFYKGPFIFATFFGENWVNSGVYATILSPMFFLNFIVSPLTYTYYIANKQKEDFIFHFVFLIGTFLVFYLSQNNSVEHVLSNYSLLYSVLFLLYFFRSLKFAHGSN